MRLSIGVPAYNQGSFLRETLESLIHQDVPFDQIVVSNNHSTDSTADVIAEFQRDHPGRLVAIMPPQHMPLAAHWNFLTGHLTGDWISLMSSDDLAWPNFVSSVQMAAARSSNCALVRGPWRDIDMKGNKLEDHLLLSSAKVTRPPKTLYEQRFGPKGSFASFALRRDIWEKVGGFPESAMLLGDWSMWLLAGALGDICCTDAIIASYRIGHQSSVVRGRQHTQVRELYTMYSEILPHATELGGFGRPTWIERASRLRLRQALIGSSQDFAAGERGLLIEAFRPWAEATGKQWLFKRFERGDVLHDLNPIKPLRNLLRRIVSALRAGTPSRSS